MTKRSSSRIRVCGVQLVQMIRLVCKAVEARSGRKKRDVASYFMPREYMQQQVSTLVS